jgi:hypothetical protein
MARLAGALLILSVGLALYLVRTPLAEP